MKYLPSVIKAKYIEGYVIELTFDDGTQKSVDFSIWLKGPVFEPLKNISIFKKFFVDGSSVTWPNGADIAPETLYKALDVKSGDNRVNEKNRR